MTTPVPDLSALVTQIAAIGTEHLPFDVPENRVLPLFGVDKQLLSEWIAHGVRSRVDSDRKRYFSSTELHFLALRTGLGGVYRRTLDTWAAAARASRAPVGGYRISYHAQPVEGLAAGTIVTALTPDGPREVEYRPSEVIASFEVRNAAPPAVLDVALREALLQVAALDLVFVPDSLRGSADFLRRTGFLDCEDAGAEVLRLCRERGLPARPVYGLITSTPLGSPHSCVEVMVEGSWVAVSPLLIGTVHRFAGLDTHTFPAWAALGSMYVPLATEPTAFIRHEDIVVPAAAMVSPIP